MTKLRRKAETSSGGISEVGEVLFLVPAQPNRPFFADLYRQCERKIEATFGEKLRPIWRFANSDGEEFDDDVPKKYLSRELGWSSRICALVVVPTSRPSLHSSLLDILEAEGISIPIVAFLLPFHGRERPRCVLCHSADGAARLGADAAKRLGSASISQATILLMHGEKKRLDSRSRIANFVRGFNDAEGAHIQSTCIYREGKWTREQARRTFAALVNQSNERIDVVFAANDEMALGIRDAITSHAKQGTEGTLSTAAKKRVKNVMIYGFDALDEMRALLRDDDHHMKGTVKQPLENLAEELANAIKIELRAIKRGSAMDSLPAAESDFDDVEWDRVGSTGAPSNESVVKQGAFIFVRPEILLAEEKLYRVDTPHVAVPGYLGNESCWVSAEKAVQYFGTTKITTLRTYANRWKRTENKLSDDDGFYAVVGVRPARILREVKSVGFVWYVGGMISREGD